MYQNNGDGSFTNVTSAYDLADLWSYSRPNGDHADHHGATWADFDNDGDQDLLISSGGRSETQLLMNKGGYFSDVTVAYNISNTTFGGGRLPVWFDYNNDGRLDVQFLASTTSAHLYRQGSSSFTDTGTQLQRCSRGHYAQLSDVKNDGKMKLICENHSNQFPDKVYDYSTLPFTNITTAIPLIENVTDTIVADLNGDLLPDVFAINGNLRISGASQTGANTLAAHLVAGGGNEKIVTYNTDGIITIEMFWDVLDMNPDRYRDRIWIGSGSLHPSSLASVVDNTDIGTYKFTLDPANPNYYGIKSHNPTRDEGVYIGYDPVIKAWKIILSTGGNWSDSTFIVSSTTAMSNVVLSGKIYSFELPMKPTLLLNSASGFVNATVGSGLDNKITCISAAAGDFDNDMDLDIYIVCRGATNNIANRLYQNNGNGTFTVVPGAGGAEGLIGEQLIDGVGTGENVVLADYDVDGFLDMFVTNGLNMVTYRQGGPDEMFHNLGNSNHWIELDLNGTESNRDGIGAKVYATVGGVTQLREANGGYHRWAQNDKRLHFGLAGNTVVDLRVQWPSGTVDTFAGVNADQLYRVTEGGQITPINVGTVKPSPCQPPVYDMGTEAAIFLWKDCVADIWHMRSTAGGVFSQVAGRIFSDRPTSSLTPYSVETGDILDNTDPSKLVFDFRMWGSSEDGMDFSYPKGANVCLMIDNPSGGGVLLGERRVFMDAPLDLNTLDSCELPNEPPVITGQVPLSTPQNTELTLVLGNLTVTDPDNAYPADFTLNVQTGANYTVSGATITPATGFAGALTVPVTVNDGSANSAVFNVTVSVVDNAPSPCGTPAQSPGTEAAVFVWKNCTTGIWSMRVTAGGGSQSYSGSVDSSQPFSTVTPVSVEASDTLNYTTDPSRIVFGLTTTSTYQDGFNFSFPASADVCFNVNQPAGATVYVGGARTVVGASFSLATLGACSTN